MAVIGLIALVTAGRPCWPRSPAGRWWTSVLLLDPADRRRGTDPVLFRTMLGEHTLTEAVNAPGTWPTYPIFLGATLFWMIYDQAGKLLNLFAAGQGRQPDLRVSISRRPGTCR